MKTWKTKSGYKIVRILFGRSNVFLLQNNRVNVLIDTCSAAFWKLLDGRLRLSGINHIDYLVLTHSHYDHADNASKIKKEYNASVVIHRSESENLTSGKAGMPRGTNPLSKFITDNMEKVFASKRFATCSYDILVDDFYNMEDWGFSAFIINTPGHTPGSVSIIVDDEIAIVGDTMFGVFRYSVFPPFAADERQLLKSWGKLLETKCTLFLPSHGTENPRWLVQKDYNNRIRNLQ
jgi:glyoxylase-like metal-dependent hydrolase (beta-lactamase superfamily II)